LTFKVLASAAVPLSDIVLEYGPPLDVPPLQPVAAATVNVNELVEVALPDEAEALTHAAEPLVSTVTGVLPFAAATDDNIVTVCATPGT
jgi:hypothetical protein